MAVYTTIDNPELYFQVKLYTGTGSSLANTGVGFQPDLTWIKGRSGATEHVLTDSVRGVTKELSSNDNGAEETVAQGLTAFGSDGFTVGTDGSYNTSSATYASWNWKESATAGFDIVTYAGNGSAARELAHSLSATPHFIIVKNRDDAVDWFVYHQGMTDDYNNKLNTTDAEFGGAYIYDPTSSIFKLRDHNVVNDSGDDYIAYAWSEKQGFSKFGGYTGNGNADGPFIYTGFKPAFVIYKGASGTGAVDNWEMHDNKRDIFNPMDTILYPNLPNAESDPASTTDRLDFLSNGFKIRTGSGDYNASGTTYIYMAFAEAPFVNSNGVPCNAR